MSMHFTGAIQDALGSQQGTQSTGGLAQGFADHGFDQILVAGHDAATTAEALLGRGKLPGITIQHRPWANPVDAAEILARLNNLNGGGLAVEIIGRPVPSELGSFLHEADQSRTDEYLTLLKRLWLNTKPIDCEGEYFSVRGGSLSTRPEAGKTIPFVLRGRSMVAIRVAARHANVFSLGGASLAEASHVIGQVEASAISFGNP